MDVIVPVTMEPPMDMENTPAATEDMPAKALVVDISLAWISRSPAILIPLWLIYALVCVLIVLVARPPPPLTEALKILALIAAEDAIEVALISAFSMALIVIPPKSEFTVDDSTYASTSLSM